MAPVKIESILSSSVMFSIHVATDELLRDFQKMLKHEGVHFNQALILLSLCVQESPLRPSQIARVLKTARPSISHALRDLEQKGLVERSMRTDDARALDIRLSLTGRQKAERLLQIFNLAEKHASDSLPDKAEMRTLFKLIGRPEAAIAR